VSNIKFGSYALRIFHLSATHRKQFRAFTYAEGWGLRVARKAGSDQTDPDPLVFHLNVTLVSLLYRRNPNIAHCSIPISEI
jgi:hypothetical protein